MLRFGIMGAGGIAHSFQEAIVTVPDIELVAVASKDEARAKAWAMDSGYAEGELRCYGEYASFLEDKAIDVVYIATTVNYHYENIKACLLAGKHVLCEKAMVETEDQARELFALAEEKQLFLMEAMWSRFLPKTQIVRQWIAQERIGEVKSIQATIGFAAPKDYESRLYNPGLGGGAFYDIGVYLIDLLPYFVDQEILSTEAKVQWAPTGVDDTVHLRMELSKGAVAEGVMTFSAVVPEDVYIYGSKGYIHIPKLHWGKNAILYDGAQEMVEEFAGADKPGFSYEIGEVAACIKDGRLTSSVASPEMTYCSSHIYDLYLSEKEGRYAK